MSDIETGRQWTRGQVLESALNFGQYLISDCRLKTGDIVCFITHNNDIHMIALLGVLAAGGVYTSLNITSTENEIVDTITEIKSITIIIGYEKNIKFLRQLNRKFNNIKSILLLNDNDVVVGEEHDIPDQQPVIHEDSRSVETILKITTTAEDNNITNQQQRRRQLSIVGQPDDLVTLEMSSGSTTGHQKAIIWTNRQWLALMAIEQHREVLPLTAADIMLSRTSFHLMGVRYLFYTIVASGSAQLVITTNRLPNDKIFQAIHDYSVTMYFAVPTELWFLAKHYRKYDKQYLKSLRDLRVGGDSLTNEVYNKINRLYGFNKFRRTYGMSECGLVFIVPSSEQNIANHTDSIGKVGPGLEVKIIDTISGNSLPANQTGQICIRGPTLTPGYYGNPSATKQLFTTDGFLLSADLGYYDENEYFYFVDRLKDVIKFDDKNISPKELELQLMTHPLVDMAAVLGIDDQQYGQIPRAFVTLIATDTADNTDDTDGVMKLREQDIQQYVNERVNVYKQLRGGVKIIDKMPMTSLGKISKAKLREI